MVSIEVDRSIRCLADVQIDTGPIGLVPLAARLTVTHRYYCRAPQPIMPPLVGCEADKFLEGGGKAWIVGWSRGSR